MRRVVRERRGPEELARLAVVEPDAAALGGRDGDVARDAARDVRVDPFDVRGIGIDDGADQGLLVRDVHVPVVAGQMLVVPDELARVGIQRDRRVAVEVGRRVARDRVDVAAVTIGARVRHRVRDAPVEDSAHGIVASPGSPRSRRGARRRACRPTIRRRARRRRGSCGSATLLCPCARRARRDSSSSAPCCRRGPRSPCPRRRARRPCASRRSPASASAPRPSRHRAR